MKPENFRQIISQAIEGEIEAYTYYRTVSEGPGSLHVEEAQDYKIADTLESPPLSASLKPINGITLAIRKELDAMQMYTQLSQVAGDPEEKKTFLELAKMERGHKARLEDIYTNMAFPEVW